MAHPLVELATTAAAQPPPLGSGPYSYVHTRGWCLTTSQSTDGRLLDVRTVEFDREYWRADDGSGRIEETRGGQRSRVSGVFGPGGLSTGSVLDASARTGSPLPSSDSAIDCIRQLRSTWLTQAVAPELQGRLLLRLSAHEGLRFRETRDRAGRPGIAVSTEVAGPYRRTSDLIVLDSHTGMLLAAEETTAAVGGPPEPVPGPASTTLWLHTGLARTTDERPIG